ncbi:MAG TPA: hypothetical protein VJP45_09455 [Candidatus Limnocylindria bacterium]|nr:hypothetical protein [Candidatus Limnocylindria bacterium]
MKLITAHRILIGAAIAFFVLYAALSFRHGAPVHAVVSVAIAIGLVVYYRTLRRRWR